MERKNTPGSSGHPSLTEQQYKTARAHRYDYGSPDLDAKLAKTAPNESVSSRFLIKMEIARLAKTCHRLIDLRDLQHDALQVDFNGIKHYMNEATQQQFMQEVKKYNGYTYGVYETIQDNAKNVRLNKIANQNADYIPDAELFSLTGFYARKEQRLYCVSDINIYFQDPADIAPEFLRLHNYVAKSTDISPDGLRIRVGFRFTETTQDVFVRFSEFEKEHVFIEKPLFKYQILSRLEKNGHFYYKLKMAEGQHGSPRGLEFDEFLTKYIVSQTRRYKIPIENTHEAVIVKGLEQYVIGKLHVLPLFLRQVGQQWLPEAIFLTQENEATCLKLYDQQNTPEFHQLMAIPLIQSALASGQRFSLYFLYIQVISPDDRAGFVCIPLEECLRNPEALAIAQLAFAKSAGNLSLFLIEGMAIHPEQECHVPSSLPDSAGEVFLQANRTPIERARMLTSGFKRMVTLCDETELLQKMTVFSDQAQVDMPMDAILKYIPRKEKQLIEPYIVKNELDDKRVEPRFAFRMPVIFHSKHKVKENQNAVTVDISANGLQMTVSHAAAFFHGDNISLDFPAFKNPAGEYLCGQPYRVVAVTGNNVHLAISGNQRYHEGRKLLHRVITENINSLTVVGSKDGIFGLSRVIRNIFSFNHPFPELFIKRSGRIKYVSDLAVSKNTRVPRFVDHDGDNIDVLQMIMKNDIFIMLLNRAWAEVKESEQQATFHVAVTVRVKSGQEGYYIMVKDADEMIAEGRIKDYMQQSSLMGSSRLLRIAVTRRNKIYNKYFKDELAYLTHYAPNRAKDALDAVSEVLAIASMMDITQHTSSLFI